MVEFNRSNYLKQRHSEARKQRALYEGLTGESAPYSSFFRNYTLLEENIVVYDVSMQVSYTSQKNALAMISAETFKVVALRSRISDDQVYAETTNALVNAVSKDTGGKINPKTASMILENPIYNNINLKPIRGIEEDYGTKITPEMIERLKDSPSGMYVDKNDVSFTYKNKRGNTSKMNMNLGQYFNY